jgi:hypothetical protein
VVIVGAVGLGIGFLLPSILHAKPRQLPTTTDLSPQPASTIWTPIVYQGEPPSDVLSNLVVPQGARVVSYDNLDGSTSQYDRSVTLWVDTDPSDVLGFYHVELPALGWKLRGAAPTADRKGTIILGYRFSKDSYQWQIHASAEPETRGGIAGSKVVVEAYQQSDEAS